MAKVLSMLVAAALLTAAIAPALHLIRDGECWQMTMHGRVQAQLALEVVEGLQKRGCDSVDYTVEIGSSRMDVETVGVDIGQVDVRIFAPEGTQACNHDDLAQLTDSCSGFDSMTADGICASQCPHAAEALLGDEPSCMVPGNLREMLDEVTSTCSGYVEVDDPALVEDEVLVGLNDRCAVGFCERGQCPRCSPGLTCMAAAEEPCAGVCFGACKAVEMSECKTCRELGWSADSGDATVCGESDASGLECESELSQVRAYELCESIGARLCTAEELYFDREAVGTGCGHNNRMIWSSSQTISGRNNIPPPTVGPCGEFEAIVISGNGHNGDAPQCVNVEEPAAALRCCSDTVCDRAESDVMTVLRTIPELSTFVTTLIAAGDETNSLITGPGPLTVFAPTNDAFSALGDQMASLIRDRQALSSTLAFHVAYGEILASDIHNGMEIETVEGRKLSIFGAVEGDQFHFNIVGGSDSNIAHSVQTDLAAYNGVIHLISAVLQPPAGVECSTCSELGWSVTTYPTAQGSAEVCGESDDGFTCEDRIGFRAAGTACSDFGARLCTAQELLGGAARGTGCGHDDRYVWSSSEGLQHTLLAGGHLACGEGAHIAVFGGQDTNLDGDPIAVCVGHDLSDESPSLRCCADTACDPGSGGHR